MPISVEYKLNLNGKRQFAFILGIWIWRKKTKKNTKICGSLNENKFVHMFKSIEHIIYVALVCEHHNKINVYGNRLKVIRYGYFLESKHTFLLLLMYPFLDAKFMQHTLTVCMSVTHTPTRRYKNKSYESKATHHGMKEMRSVPAPLFEYRRLWGSFLGLKNFQQIGFSFKKSLEVE